MHSDTFHASLVLAVARSVHGVSAGWQDHLSTPISPSRCVAMITAVLLATAFQRCCQVACRWRNGSSRAFPRCRCMLSPVGLGELPLPMAHPVSPLSTNPPLKDARRDFRHC